MDRMWRCIHDMGKGYKCLVITIMVDAQDGGAGGRNTLGSHSSKGSFLIPIADLEAGATWIVMILVARRP